MKIKIYNKFNLIPDSESFVDNIPIFATQQYADVLKETKGYHTIWFEGVSDSNIRYLIPFAVKKKGIFKKGMFLTSTIYLGKENEIEYEKEFLNELIHIIKKDKLCDWIQQCPNWAIFNTYPDGAIYAPFGSYIINLSSHSIEQLFSKLAKKKRQYIKKGLRDGVEIKEGNQCLAEIYRLIIDTAQKGEISYPSYYNFIKMHEMLKGYIFSYIAYYKKIAQSALVIMSSKYSIYTFYAGTISKPARGSSELLYWKVIEDAKLRNITLFDFVGARLNPDPNSKQAHIQRFKSEFGTQLRKGYLWKLPILNFKYHIYILTIKCINLLKAKKYKGDIIDQEIKKLGS